MDQLAVLLAQISTAEGLGSLPSLYREPVCLDIRE
jgi:hypothetical protein